MRWTVAGSTIGRAGLARCATFGNRDAGSGLAESPRTFTEEVYNMDYLIALGVIYVVGYLIYRNGKREGSRKGYGVGLNRGRRGRGRRRH